MLHVAAKEWVRELKRIAVPLYWLFTESDPAEQGGISGESQAFEKIAQGLGLQCKGASAAYYRVVKKLRKELRGE